MAPPTANQGLGSVFRNFSGLMNKNSQLQQNNNKNKKSVPYASSSFQTVERHALVIGHLHRHGCADVRLDPFQGLDAQLPRLPRLSPSHHVSIPAHLLPFHRSNPDPVKGLWALLPKGRSLLCLSRRDQSRTASLSYSFLCLL